MREIAAGLVGDAVRRLLLEANVVIGPDVRSCIEERLEAEPSPEGRDVLEQILENQHIAQQCRVPMCQDTGMAVVFLRVGQDAHIVGDLTAAVNDGVRAAYDEGYFRKSVVKDPLFERVNTNDNTPCVLHVELVTGDRVHVTVAPKGFGSENMSALRMLAPAEGEEGVRQFVLDTVSRAGPNPCPPLVIGVGIGGTMELAALMAKRMTMRPLGSAHADPRYAELERALLTDINKLGIGPVGIGGRTTALGVHIDTYPTHIAGLPVAVNMCCHCARHAETTI